MYYLPMKLFFTWETKITHCFKFTPSKKKIKKSCQVQSKYIKSNFHPIYKLYLSRRNDEKRFDSQYQNQCRT